MCRFSSTPIPKSPVLGRFNTGISVLQKWSGSRNTGIRDPGIAIPNCQLYFMFTCCCWLIAYDLYHASLVLSQTYHSIIWFCFLEYSANFFRLLHVVHMWTMCFISCSICYMSCTISSPYTSYHAQYATRTSYSLQYASCHARCATCRAHMHNMLYTCHVGLRYRAQYATHVMQNINVNYLLAADLIQCVSMALRWVTY